MEKLKDSEKHSDLGSDIKEAKRRRRVRAKGNLSSDEESECESILPLAPKSPLIDVPSTSKGIVRENHPYLSAYKQEILADRNVAGGSVFPDGLDRISGKKRRLETPLLLESTNTIYASRETKNPHSRPPGDSDKDFKEHVLEQIAKMSHKIDCLTKQNENLIKIQERIIEALTINRNNYGAGNSTSG
uniref:Putative product n=1 Tax=Xenopsylla cheopis TaxID=163159 RepID=A0A6M2DQM1_XENCH